MDRKQVEHCLGQDHIAEIRRAARALDGVVRPTPLIRSDYYSGEYGCEVFIKPEQLQVTGSFKIRGAYNKIANLEESERAKGVIASSAGNHAQGVALSARRMGCPATIVMPNITPLLKVNATKAYGADVILAGDVYDESYNRAVEIAEREGMVFVHPFDDYDVICGQGTIALEILAELPDADEILVPIGGGGLISGIALAAKAINPKVKIIGVVPKGAGSMKISLAEGRVSRLAEVKTAAEGVAVKQPGDLTFEIARSHVDDIVTVSEKDIMESVLLIIEKHKFIAETAGVVPIAGLKKRAKGGRNKKIVCVMSGGNIDTVTLSSIINQGMISRGRIMCFSVELPDRPGQLVAVATLLANLGANVIELEHNQFKAVDRYSDKVALEVTVETNGPEHIREILTELEDEGYTVARIY
ncbi:MAG: threonine ammonia-lyase [Clostridiales Family XIII bacterium]|jgi:threonine dehydratase|nr:threonine ammonia-lyase [Clostridiales Family XIII bacterium]